MEAPTPSTFPVRSKRFQSYSMTPMDFQPDVPNQSLYSTTSSSNKFNWLVARRKAGQQAPCVVANPVTNQFSSGQKAAFNASDPTSLKHLQGIQQINEIQQLNSAENIPLASEHKRHRKMITSEIFLFSSMKDKNSFTDEKNSANLLSRFKNGERKSIQNDFLKKQLYRQDKKDKQSHIPSFLLNKKKQIQNSQILNNGAMTGRDMTQSMPVFANERSGNETRANFKKPSIQMVSRNLETENFESQFYPPSNQKIAFSKTTASTLCTNLPREESRRTFKDFQEMCELKEIQNSMEESDNAHNVKNDFQKLFLRQQEPQLHTGMLESQIAELFSDQDLDSEEFNEELQNELEDLF